MKLLKSDSRQRLTDENLNNIMVVKLECVPIEQFNPNPAIDVWLLVS